MRAAAVLLVALSCWGATDEDALRQALAKGTGVVTLPPRAVELHAGLEIPPGAHDLEIRGVPGSLLRAAVDFKGRALISIKSAARIRLTGFAIDGNRAALEKPLGLPPYDVPFCRFYSNSGVLAEDAQSLSIAGLRFDSIAGFAILTARSRDVRIDTVRIENSGSRAPSGRNNTTGGILLEEGTSGFTVANCALRNIRGNGVWTHSFYTSPRNRDGVITGNEFSEIARDAIQVGHATNIRVERNRGARIGYPVADVDPNAGPVGIDTAGNVDRSVYAGNRFEDIDGKCIDLDGFHDGEVRGNVCVNKRPRAEYPYGHFAIVMNNTNPDMRSERIVLSGNEVDGAVYGAVFVIGSGHVIERNRFRNLNLAHCAPSKPGCVYWQDEPGLLSSGIYLGKRAERPANTRGNTIRGNEISGFGPGWKCIAAAPGVPLPPDARLNHCEVLK